MRYPDSLFPSKPMIMCQSISELPDCIFIPIVLLAHFQSHSIPVAGLLIFLQGQVVTLATDVLGDVGSRRLLSGLGLRLLIGDSRRLLLVMRIDKVQPHRVVPGKAFVAMHTHEGVSSSSSRRSV